MGLHPQAQVTPWPRLGRVWPPQPNSGSALLRTSYPQNPKTRGTIIEEFRRCCGAENTGSSPAGRNLLGKFLPERGKSSPSSPPSSWTSSGSSSPSPSSSAPSSSPSPPRPAVTSWVGSCVVHRGNFPRIDYSLQLMILSVTIGLRFMSRLLFIIIPSLIMIYMMAREQFVQFLRTWEKSCCQQ